MILAGDERSAGKQILHRLVAAPVFDGAALDPGEAGPVRRSPFGIAGHEEVVVVVGDVPAPVGVQGEGERAHRERLEVVGEAATDHA
mgnify:CR=1 FL=1